MPKLNKTLSCIMLAGAFLVPSAVSATPINAFEIQGGTIAGNQAFSGPLGQDFQVNEAVTVSALGAFDSNADGFVSTITVSLFNLADTTSALATSVFSGLAGSLDGQYRYQSITDLTLDPGTYSVVAVGYSSVETNGNNNVSAIPLSANDGAGLISFVDSRFGFNVSAFPTLTTVGNSPCSGAQETCFAAGSFQFVSEDVQVSPVPLPAAGWMLVVGLLGLSRLGKRA